MIGKGDKVICISNDSWDDPYLVQENVEGVAPKEGDILNVIGTRQFDGKTFLYFKEISIKGSDGDRECYEISSFRKLPPPFRNDITRELANTPIIQEGIERIIVQPKLNSYE